MGLQFPSKRVVWSRAILGGIVNATMTAQEESFACFEGWVRNHYVLNGADGRCGSITFAGGHWYAEGPLVGVFHDVHSDRYDNVDEVDLERFFMGCPTYQRSLAEQAALSYLRPEFEGRLLHCVTAAFWDEGDSVTAPDPWDEIIRDGASLISEEMSEDQDAALSRFAEGYGMTEEQVAFARSLYDRKNARPPALIELSMDEGKFLESTFKDPIAKYAELHRLMTRFEPTGPSETEGSRPAQEKWWEAIDTKAEFEKAMRTSREKFAELGIVMP